MFQGIDRRLGWRRLAFNQVITKSEAPGFPAGELARLCGIVMIVQMAINNAAITGKALLFSMGQKAMKHLTIVVPDSQISLSSMACIIGTYEMFIAANAYRKEKGGDELFAINLAGISDHVELLGGRLSLNDLSTFSHISRTDLIIIPALVPDFKNNAEGNRQLAVRVEWAKKAFENTFKTINEIMYEAGYNDVKAFRRVFRKITGISPLEYRSK